MGVIGLALGALSMICGSYLIRSGVKRLERKASALLLIVGTIALIGGAWTILCSLGII